ncbi:hypothetical protein Hanom_Chr17g01574211 [Helianthus anomalus]
MLNHLMGIRMLRKQKSKQTLKPKQVLKNNKVEKPTILPKTPMKLEKPKQIWKPKFKAATSPILEMKRDMCLKEVSYFNALEIPRPQ